jgi:transposase InsO family protein
LTRGIRATDVINIFADVTIERGVPEFIRSDNGLEMVAKTLRNWLARLGIKTLYVSPGSPWENGYYRSMAASDYSATQRLAA